MRNLVLDCTSGKITIIHQIHNKIKYFMGKQIVCCRNDPDVHHHQCLSGFRGQSRNREKINAPIEQSRRRDRLMWRLDERRMREGSRRTGKKQRRLAPSWEWLVGWTNGQEGWDWNCNAKKMEKYEKKDTFELWRNERGTWMREAWTSAMTWRDRVR